MSEKSGGQVDSVEVLSDEKIRGILRDLAAFYGVYRWIKSPGEDKSVSVENGNIAKKCPERCPNLFDEIRRLLDLSGGTERVTEYSLLGRFEILRKHFPAVIRVEKYRGHLGDHIVDFDPSFENAFEEPALKVVEKRMFEDEYRGYEGFVEEKELGKKLAEVFGR